LDCLAPDAPKYQYGKGCLSDQLFGQLCAKVAGLGYLVDPNMVKSGLKSVFKYNFRDPLGDHANMQRIYAVSDESGLLLCSWPRGSRPQFPFVYSDEVWTGIEYQVANHLIYEGMVGDGLKIVRAVRKRYDGIRRNPYNEFECGSHYARAMSSWGLVLSLSGFSYDGVDKTVYLNPQWNKGREMKCFFSTNTVWGVFEYKSGHLKLMPIEGQLTVNRVVTDSGDFTVPAGSRKVSSEKPLIVQTNN
jgi:non-lysosomal glucosylceramidase